MERIVYIAFGIAFMVLCSGTIHGADRASLNFSNLSQSPRRGMMPMVVTQDKRGQAERPRDEGQKLVAAKTIPTTPEVPLGPLVTRLPGEVAIRSHFGAFLTAVGGGGQTTDAIHTDLKDASKIGSWEKFKLFLEPATGPRSYAIQTTNGHYVTAVGGGGQSAPPVLETNGTQVQAWEKFNVFRDWIYHSFRASNGDFLSFVNGTIRTDGDGPPHDNEAFILYQCGDPGSDAKYMIAWANTGDKYKYERQIPLQAYGGGGRAPGTGVMGSYDGGSSHYGTVFRLIRQPDGSYAIQTENGTNYLTAEGGGGTSVQPLATNRTQVKDWEKFRLWILPDCAYAFGTHNETWLGMWGGHLTTHSRAIGDINRFRLHPADFESFAGGRGSPGGISGEGTPVPPR